MTLVGRANVLCGSNAEGTTKYANDWRKDVCKGTKLDGRREGRGIFSCAQARSLVLFQPSLHDPRRALSAGIKRALEWLRVPAWIEVGQ